GFTITFAGTETGKNIPTLSATYTQVGAGSTGTASESTTTPGSGSTTFNFNALDSTGLTHSYGVMMAPTTAGGTVTWTPRLVSVDNHGYITGNLDPAGAGSPKTFSFKQPDS